MRASELRTAEEYESKLKHDNKGPYAEVDLGYRILKIRISNEHVAANLVHLLTTFKQEVVVREMAMEGSPMRYIGENTNVKGLVSLRCEGRVHGMASRIKIGDGTAMCLTFHQYNQMRGKIIKIEHAGVEIEHIFGDSISFASPTGDFDLCLYQLSEEIWSALGVKALKVDTTQTSSGPIFCYGYSQDGKLVQTMGVMTADRQLFHVRHTATTVPSWSGTPIFNSDKQVVAIHVGYRTKEDENLAVLPVWSFDKSTESFYQERQHWKKVKGAKGKKMSTIDIMTGETREYISNGTTYDVKIKAYTQQEIDTIRADYLADPESWAVEVAMDDLNNFLNRENASIERQSLMDEETRMLEVSTTTPQFSGPAEVKIHSSPINDRSPTKDQPMLVISAGEIKVEREGLNFRAVQKSQDSICEQSQTTSGPAAEKETSCSEKQVDAVSTEQAKRRRRRKQSKKQPKQDGVERQSGFSLDSTLNQSDSPSSSIASDSSQQVYAVNFTRKQLKAYNRITHQRAYVQYLRSHSIHENFWMNRCALWWSLSFGPRSKETPPPVVLLGYLGEVMRFFSNLTTPSS